MGEWSTIASAERVGRFLVPSRTTWLRASRIVAKLREAGKTGPAGRGSSFFNDCLLAASAREHGFTLVTYNLGDFATIALAEPCVRSVAPFP